jgi:hypothetical protein
LQTKTVIVPRVNRARANTAEVCDAVHSAAFALGAILGGIGASQCTTFTRPNGTEELDCNNAGDVLLPLGGTIAALSFVGMLTTGIMLGVRNKHKREIEREIRRRYTARRLHFDERSGGLVF